MGNYEYEPIKKLKENNKKKMFFMFLTIFMFLGISLATIYFVYRFNDERENTITSGLVDIDFKELSPSINLQNTVPMADEIGKQNEPYIFTVENISKIPVNLKIGIEIGTNTIDLSAIRYALYLNNEEVKVGNLENLDNGNLYIKEQFEVGAKIEVKLVFWIDYYYEKSGGSFSGKIKVEGEQYDIIYEKTGVETIKGTVVSNVTDTCTDPSFNGGLVAINTKGTLYNKNNGDIIREYRYVGEEVKNYIYYNCQDGKEQNGDNCEVWRIIGVFKDEAGEEHLKIVKNNVLTGDMFPTTFIANGTTYKIQSTSSGNYAYWNNDGKYNNNWPIAGIQYWLNAGSDKETKTASDGYMSYLSKNAKSMIENTKYYLGNVNSNKDTLLNYSYERGNTSCSESCSGGDIWEGNQATWNGDVALMYPSDLRYTINSCYWSVTLDSSVNGYSKTNWLQTTANHNEYEFLLSPSYNDFNRISYWHNDGGVGYIFVHDNATIRPSINLKSNVKIDSGTGEQGSPYTLKMD